MNAEPSSTAVLPAEPDGQIPPDKAAGLRTDTLVDSVVILLAMTGVQRLVGFCRAVLFCRWLDPEQLGQWDMAFGFLMLAGPLAVLALPGTFGRYVERYRQQGLLRAFLRRIVAACAALTALTVVVIYFGQRWFSELIFGTPGQTELVVLLALSLTAVLAYNFMIELFTALRNIRLISGMQMANSLIFATLGVSLLLGWRCAASSVVIAYGGACLACACGGSLWLRRIWKALPESAGGFAQGELWSKLIPFAGWMLAVSVLTSLFEIVDRYMIVHYSGGSAAAALARVGDYHSSRVVPVLLVSIAAMLGTMITPHLSHDWEAGRRDRVSARLNLFLKLLAFALIVGAVVVVFAAPLLFGVAFQGKFAGGLAVLPWTLTY
ncbi:hypothetical protein LCGC14_2535460, partial [marine sediment metagenome]